MQEFIHHSSQFSFVKLIGAIGWKEINSYQIAIFNHSESDRTARSIYDSFEVLLMIQTKICARSELICRGGFLTQGTRTHSVIYSRCIKCNSYFVYAIFTMHSLNALSLTDTLNWNRFFFFCNTISVYVNARAVEQSRSLLSCDLCEVWVWVCMCVSSTFLSSSSSSSCWTDKLASGIMPRCSL